MAGAYQIYPRKRRSVFERLSVNNIFILTNVFAFVVFTILISANILSIDSIALNPSNVFSGKYLWTFLSSMFMHAGFFHLFVNMLSLFFIGSLIEKIIGRKRYFWFYLYFYFKIVSIF